MQQTLANGKHKDTQQVKANFLQECRFILNKNYQSRQASQNQTLMKLVEKANFLKEAKDIVSVDFVKDLIKNAKIQFIDERQILIEEGQPINHFIIVLEGKLGIQKTSFTPPLDDDKDEILSKVADMKLQQMKVHQMLEKLTTIAKNQREQLKKSNKLQRKSSLPISGYYQNFHPLLSQSQYQTNCEHIQKYITANQQFGIKERVINNHYKNRVIAVERSKILIIQINLLFYELQLVLKAKIYKIMKRLRQIPAFDILEDEKLSEIIFNLKLNKPRKNDVIYREGDVADTLFILFDGQIKLTKQANLFMENPNDLYVDRRRLIRQIHYNEKRSKAQSKLLDQNDGVLPFANLTTLYNYRPIKKTIDIAAVSQFGLFGGEQLIYGTNRQTNAYVNSLNTLYYKIDFKDILQILGPKLSQSFKQTLEMSISGKVLYRQKEFAAHINFQNKNNLNYFFLDDPKRMDNPRRFKLQKINEVMKVKTARDTYNHAPPFYTASNFNKMLDRKRYTSQSKKSSSKQKATNSSLSIEELQASQLNESEEKVVSFSHSWSPIEKKVNKQKIVSNMISPFKHKINIREPLIDQQFFISKDLQTKRINKQFRTVKLSIPKKYKEGQ